MKKQMFFAAGLSLITTQQSFSQTSLPFQIASASLVNNTANVGNPDPVAGEASTVNSKALTSFNAAYPEANQVRWNTNSKGSYAYFVSEGSSVRVSYNQRGKWTSTVTAIQPEKLPVDVTRLVNSEYPDFTIAYAHNVRVLGGSAYVLKVQSPSRWMTLKVSDNGIDVIDDFAKQ